MPHKVLQDSRKALTQRDDLQAFLVFSQYPAWVYYPSKSIEHAVYCLYETVVTVVSSSNFLRVNRHNISKVFDQSERAVVLKNEQELIGSRLCSGLLLARRIWLKRLPSDSVF